MLMSGELRPSMQSGTISLTGRGASADMFPQDEESLMLKKIALLSMLGVFVLTISACNTTEGVGEDVENLGEGVQDMAS